MNDQVTPAETAELLRLAERCLDQPGDFVELGCYRGDTSVLLGKLLQKTAEQKSAGQKSNERKTTEYKSAKHLWLYDSFAGLPTKTAEDSSGAGANFQAGELLITKRAVIDKLRKNGLKIANNPRTFNNPEGIGTAEGANRPQNLDQPSSNQPLNQPSSAVIVKKAWFDDLAAADLPAEIAFAFLDGDLYSSIKTSLHLVAPRLAPQGIMVVHDYNNPELPGSARAVDEWLRTHREFSLSVRHSLAILRRVC